jgi:hypothetical protein
MVRHTMRGVASRDDSNVAGVWPFVKECPGLLKDAESVPDDSRWSPLSGDHRTRVAQTVSDPGGVPEIAETKGISCSHPRPLQGRHDRGRAAHPVVASRHTGYLPRRFQRRGFLSRTRIGYARDVSPWECSASSENLSEKHRLVRVACRFVSLRLDVAAPRLMDLIKNVESEFHVCIFGTNTIAMTGSEAVCGD